MKHWIFVFAIVFLASADELQDQVNKGIEGAIKHLPAGTLDNLPSNFNASNIPSIEEGEELLKKKCDKNGNNESFEIAMAAKEELQFCLHRLVNFTQIQKEIEKAKPTGDLDLVFRKYCKKTPDLRNCVNNFTTAMEPCLNQNEKDTKKIVSNVTEALIKFICHKEGDRVALFIAEGGPECLSSKNESIQQCLNNTYHKYLTQEIPSPDDMPVFQLEEKQCRDIEEVQKCIVSELEKCSQPTPANIVNSLINFVRRDTPCSKYSLDGVSGSSALFSNSFLYITYTFLLVMYYKY